MFDGLISRVPIYTRSLDVFGYELRFCSGAAWREGRSDDTVSLGDCLVGASQSVKLEELTGGGTALIRLPIELLTRCTEVGWPRQQLVFAVPEPAVGAQGLSDEVSRLAGKGFKLAVDNPSSDLAVFGQEADYVSLYSLGATAATGLKALAETGLSRRRFPFLVRDLDTADQYEFFRRLNFDYFEGPFFVHPHLHHGTEVPANRFALLQILSQLQDPDVDIREIEGLVSRDLTLSYKLLRLLNSAYFGMPKRVESIRRAVLFFGLQRIKNWACVVLVNAIEFHPRELLTTALIRARMCEVIARNLGRQPPDAYYVAGLFSLLDAIMDMPMANILERLSLTPALDQALLEGTGPVGDVLQSVLAFERGDFLAAPLQGLQPAMPSMSAYLAAIAWAGETQRQLR